MTDTLHSRILRTIEDWNNDHSMGLSPADMGVLAARLNWPVLKGIRTELTNSIKLIDSVIAKASNSDAEKERDELTFRLRQCHYSLTILTSRYGHLGASKEVIEEVEKLLKIVS